MQYVRLHLNDQGDIEHTETSDRPLKDEPAIEVHQPVGLLPNMTPEQLAALPTRKRPLNHVLFNLQTSDGKFKRAREVMDSLIVNKTTLIPRLRGKTVRKFDGTIHNPRITRTPRDPR